ncbi:hypothetical protein CP533_3621 [Ophiocordyceps camponoti-saundersi (nom. inval.)]|nr:hypothetical protein CP533_3621 [Ophiocordyceps camponoti-saundersi (nom. inval.)]
MARDVAEHLVEHVIAPATTGRRLGIVTAAVTANHVRRMLAPWLGQFPRRHPIEAMKLARWSPHGHLEASLVDVSWPAAILWLFQQVIVSEMLSSFATAARRSSSSRSSASSMPTTIFRRRRGKALTKADAHRLLLLLASLTLAESRYAETCWAVALVASTGRLLLFGDRLERDFARRLVGDHPARAALLACLVLRWLRAVALPHVAWLVATLRSLRVMLPTVACCVGAGTVHLVRYSNRYFLVIEMSDMLVTWAWFVTLGALAVAHR